MNRDTFIVAILAATLWGGASFAQNAPRAPQTPAAPADSQAPNPPAEEQVTPPQNAPADPFHGMIGAWEFSNADHDKICRLNFRTDAVAAAGGYRLDVDKNCPNLFPSTKDIVAWAVDNYGSLKLLDGHGNSVVELTEVENGMYDGFTPEEGRYILQTAAAAPTISAPDVAGDWAIARDAGKPICVLTLVNSPASADALAVKIKPGCDAMVTRFNPAAWRMEQGDLVLLSQRGESWQFEQNDANTWQRVPESTDPVLLVRQTAP
jgi:Protease inhibitor Inh